MKDNLKTSPQRITTPSTPFNKPDNWWETIWNLLFVIPLGVLLKGCLSRSFLTILIALLLFVLLVWLLRSCDENRSGVSVEPPYFRYVEPGRNPMPPADPGKIGPGRDTITPIVLDRINVLLEKIDDNTGREWQLAFKRLYPGSEYQVVYFDPLTYRLQLQVPENKREYLMDNLNDQMPQFEFLLFEESVFTSGAIPADPGFNDFAKAWYFMAVKCFDAWNTTMGDPDIIVGVVDNGFDLTHPEIASKVMEPFNVSQRNQNLYAPRVSECPGHGTHVAATAVGVCNNGNGVSGIAPNCKLIPVQVTDINGNITLTNILDGILYAIYKGADVINVSLGVGTDPSVRKLSPADQLQIIVGLRKNEERVWDEVFKIADNRNCTIVLAAGNENVLSGFDAMKRSDQTIIVSAVDTDLHKATFSNYGNYIDIPYNFSTVSAPGVEIFNASSPQAYQFLQGTSMAAPIVSGAVALLKSVNRDLTTSEITEILQSTGIPLEEPIGNLIQLDAAIRAAMTGNYKKSGKSGGSFSDKQQKMKTREIIQDPTQLYGLWKSHTTVVNNRDESVDIYMSFSRTGNELIIVETDNNNARFSAGLDARIENNNLMLRQLNYATNSNGRMYEKYDFNCTTDVQGYLECVATQQNGGDQVRFNLVKIK